MKKLWSSLLISGMLVSNSLPSLQALNQNESRLLRKIEVVVPHGTWKLDEFFQQLQKLNPKVNIQWPKVSPCREFSYFRGEHDSTSIVSLEVLAEDFKYKIASFDQHFSWDVGVKHAILKSKSDKNAKHAVATQAVLPMPTWVKDLPVMNQVVSVKKGETVNLNSGNYRQPMVVEGNLTLNGDKFAFTELQVSGNLTLQNQTIAGDNMELTGNVTLGKDSHAQFETVTTRGQLDLKSGSTLKVKDIIMGDGGDVILNGTADLILN